MKWFTVIGLFLTLSSSVYSEVSFITDAEYASQLYHNPRGIGCYKCHGEKGEGKLIATYKDKGEQLSFSPPAINTLTYEAFVAAMMARQKGMPRYYLTPKEVKVLYNYLHPVEREDVK